ncbi:hypothetical protein EDB80DRAFT_594437 [Ilyonectria destructans]|nr:hypothetical protein EDB80DRAFT_594437 [Ilyonectria destructans]
MAVVASNSHIPGFHCQPTLTDLQASADTYNSLVDSEELESEISSAHLQNLAKIFVKYDVHDRLGIHLIHGHAKVAPGSVTLGHTLAEPSGCWTKPVAIEEVDLTAVHGHIFKLVAGDRFVAYEYAEGRVNNLADVSPRFIKELAEYLHSNRLEETVGLQILGQADENMVEFDLGDCGTVMLNEQDTRHGDPFRTTGWVFTLEKGVISVKGVESHAPTARLEPTTL